MSALIILRIGVVAVALFHLRWTFPAVVEAARGRWCRRVAFRSALFFLILGTVAFQGFALAGVQNDATRAMSLTLIAIGLAVCCQARVYWRQYEKVDRLFLNLDAALAIIDLWLVDPATATEKAAECLRLTVEKMARGG